MHSYIYATYVHWSDHWYYFGLRFSARIMEIMNSSHCGSKGTCKPGPAPVHTEDRMDYQGHDEGKKEHSKTSRTKLFISKNKLAIVMGKTVETLWDKGHFSFTGLSAQVSQTRKLHLLELGTHHQYQGFYSEEETTWTWRKWSIGGAVQGPACLVYFQIKSGSVLSWKTCKTFIHKLRALSQKEKNRVLQCGPKTVS